MLQYYRYLLLQTEEAQAQRTAWLADPDYPHRSQLNALRLRVFSLLPLRGYKPAHLPLTRTVMRSIFHQPDLELSDVVQEKWIKKGCYYLTSDGVACHLTLRREPPAARPRPLPFAERTRGKFRDGDVPASASVPPVVGVDPGRDRLLQASNGYRLTKGQYYDECGFNTVRQRRLAYMKTLGPDELQAQAVLESLSFKSASWQRLNEQWQQLVPHLPAVFRIYGHRDLANDKFYRYRRKQQCLERMARELVAHEPPDTVIAFGNGQFPTSYRGARAGPGSSLAKFLSRRMRVVMVDEFRTSLICSECHQPQEHRPIKTFNKKNQLWMEEKVHGILWCSHCQVFRNRDVNASHNIQDLLVKQLQGAERPLALRRGQTPQNSPGLRETAEAAHHTEESHPPASDEEALRSLRRRVSNEGCVWVRF